MVIKKKKKSKFHLNSRKCFLTIKAVKYQHRCPRVVEVSNFGVVQNLICPKQPSLADPALTKECVEVNPIGSLQPQLL